MMKDPLPHPPLLYVKRRDIPKSVGLLKFLMQFALAYLILFYALPFVGIVLLVVLFL